MRIIDLVKQQAEQPATTPPAGPQAGVHVEGTPYAQTVLAGCLNQIEAARVGSRNDTLNAQALRALSFVAGGELDYETTVTALTDSALRTGLTAAETRGTIASAWNKAQTQPAHTPSTEIGVLDVPWQGFGDDAPITGEADLMGRLVREEYRRQKARQLAAERLRLETLPQSEPFDLGTLGEMLARPAPPGDRIQGLVSWDANTLISAQRKTGKTTLALNLAHSMLSGEAFLDRFTVRPLTGLLAFLNFEVSAAQLARWADDLSIDRDRFIQVNLRGRGNPFKTPERLAELGAELRERNVESLIVDPFSNAYTSEDQNNPGYVSAWLRQLDEFARTTVGALDVVLVAHAGWVDGRTRGSTALEDWPDSIIRLSANDQGVRFISAMGRDVDIAEDALTFDETTRKLAMSGMGGRARIAEGERVADKVPLIVAAVEDEPGLSGRQLRDKVKGRPQDIAEAISVAVGQGLVRVEDGPRRSKLHYPAVVPTVTPPVPGNGVVSGSIPPYRGGNHTQSHSEPPNTLGTGNTQCPDCGEDLAGHQGNTARCRPKHAQARNSQAGGQT